MIGAALVLAQAAAQITISASAPQVVSACETLELRVTVAAPGHVAPQLIPPSLGPFQLIRRTTRPTVTFTASGDPRISVEHLYVLASERPGTYTLAPFEAELGGETVRTRPIRIDVRGGPGAGTPAVVAGARIDTTRDVNFRAVAVPDTVFVGQQVQYEVAVFLRESVRERLRRNPTFFPPDMPGMLAYDVPPTRGDPPRRQVGGRCFDALVYQRALFPLQAGRIVIPPAQLVYSLPVGRGLFSREATHELRTDSVIVVAIAPPDSGRPENDIGAVGSLAVGATVDTTSGRVGDPLLLTVRVAGDGNVKLLPRPRLDLQWGSLVADGERVVIDSASPRIRGAKEFDWLVTPRRGGRLVIPPVEYPHFDPYAGSYVVARTEPLTLEIEEAQLARVDTVVTVRRLALRAAYRGPLGRPLHSHPAVWLLAAAAPLPALIGATRRRRPRAGPARAPAAALAELPHSAALDARSVRRTFVAALADRLRMPAAAFTHAGGVERALRRAGVTRELAAEAERLLRELDAAAYGAGPGARDDARRAALTAGRIYAEVDAEALPRWELGPVATLAIALMLTGLGASIAIAAPGDDAAEFARAAHAYDAGRFAAAAEGFERLALRVPRAPDAWANFGTAAWAAADTGKAVVGWQRALRLEPHAADVRAHLDRLHWEPVGAPGYVPPVGVTPLVLAALALWVGACAAAAVRAPRGSLVNGLAAAGVASSLVLGGLAVLVDERLAARDLVVLRHGGGVSSSPAIGASRDVRAETGEVGETGAREGGWTFVRFHGGRAGWVPASELLSLARAPARGD